MTKISNQIHTSYQLLTHVLALLTQQADVKFEYINFCSIMMVN